MAQPLSTADVTNLSQADAKSSVRRVGRPRANGEEPDGDVREQILDAAAALFTKHGYTGATTREIAARAGLRQGSLAYYFPRKEAMFAELLSRTLSPAIEVFERTRDEAIPADARLWLVLESDCVNLCTDRYNTASLTLLPEAKGQRYDAYWQRHEELYNGYRECIANGVSAGLLLANDVDLVATTAISMVEGLIVWFGRDGDFPREEAAYSMARVVLRGILADPCRLDEVIESAKQFYDAIAMDSSG